MLSEFGRAGYGQNTEHQQALYVTDVLRLVFANSAAGYLHGSVIGGFVNEATDERWKAELHENREYFGVIGKESAGLITHALLERKIVFRELPKKDEPEELLSAAWKLWNSNRCQDAVVVADRIDVRYSPSAAEQQRARGGTIDC